MNHLGRIPTSRRSVEGSMVDEVHRSCHVGHRAGGAQAITIDNLFEGGIADTGLPVGCSEALQTPRVEEILW